MLAQVMQVMNDARDKFAVYLLPEHVLTLPFPVAD